MIATATELGFKKLAGFFCSGLGATYTVTVTPITGVISSFRVMKRPISGTTSNVVGLGGSSGSLSFIENNDIEFELEVWGDVKTVGTFTITSTSTGTGQGSMLASYSTDTNGNIVGLSDGSGGVIPSPSFTTNSYLKKFRLALGKTIGGLQPTKISFLGDSTTCGLNDSTGTDRWATSWINSSSSIINKALFATNNNSIFGSFFSGTISSAQEQLYDPRIASANFADWYTTSLLASGGYPFGNATTLNPLAFTPAEAFDTIEIYSLTNTGGYGTWTVNVDGGATLATVNDSGTRALRKTSVSCALGTHTINIQRNGTGGQVYIYAIITRNSTAPKIELYNIGAGSATSTTLTSSNLLTNQYLNPLIAPDLTIIDIGINDRRLGLYTSQYDTNLQLLVTGALISGDCILCVPVPSSLTNSAFTTQANQDAYTAAIYRVASANNLFVWDKRKLFGTYESNPNYYYDTLHPSDGAYGMLAQQLANVINI